MTGVRMDAQWVTGLMQGIKQCEAEQMVLACLAGNGDVRAQARHQLVARRLLLADAMFALLTKEEAQAVRLHLVEGLPWCEVVDRVNAEMDGMGPDVRTLQRRQKRAVEKIVAFFVQRFDGVMEGMAGL